MGVVPVAWGDPLEKVNWCVGRSIGVCEGSLVCGEVHWCVGRSISVWGGPLVCGEVHWCV